MGLFDFLKKPDNSAKKAKERLQIIVAHQRDGRASRKNEQPVYMEAMKREILEVVCRYVHITPEDIETNIDKDGEMEILALNINLSDKDKLNDKDKPGATELDPSET